MLEKIATILYLSGDPITQGKIAALLETTKEEISKALPDLRVKFEALGLTLIEGNDGVVVVNKPELTTLVESFRKEELKGDLTPATLQVLTLVAYLGSPTREQVSYIRGVQSSMSIRTLTVRGLIARTGEVCTLTSEALKHLGVTKIEELPEFERIHNEFSEKLSKKEE